MSNNKFTPHADATATLGTVHTKNEGRDAVHLAVYQVTLGQNISMYDKASKLTIKSNGRAYIYDEYDENQTAYGILDPFINQSLNVGDKVWLILFPGMITSLRHVWEHSYFPESPKETPISSLEDKFAEFPAILNAASQLEISCEEIINSAEHYIKTGNYYCGGNEAEGVHVGQDFWEDYYRYKGMNSDATTINDIYKGNFISCSC